MPCGLCIHWKRSSKATPPIRFPRVGDAYSQKASTTPLNSQQSPLESTKKLSDEPLNTQPNVLPSTDRLGQDGLPHLAKADDVNLQKSLQTRDLWDEAYKIIYEKDKELAESYEHILLSGDGSDQDASSPVLAPVGSHRRQEQLTALATDKLREFDDERLNITIADRTIIIQEEVDRVLRIIILAKDFVSSAVTAEPHAALAWAGICVFLPLLLNPTLQRTEAIKGFKSLPFIVRRYQVIERLRRSQNQEHPAKDTEALVIDLEHKIVDLYSKILEYQFRFIRRFSTNWFARYGRDLFKADDWQEITESISTLDSECTQLAAELNQEILESGLKDNNRLLDEWVRSWRTGLEELKRKTDENATALENHARDQQTWRLQKEARDCVRVLRAKNYYEDQKSRTPNRVAGTCNWFLNNKQFQKWRETPGSNMLWVSAAPGCGKSVLSKALIDEKLVTSETYGTTICYFFFKDISADSRSITKAFSAILHQLFTQKPILVEHALSAFARNGEDLPGLFDTMWDILVDAAADARAGEVVCILDALDECEEDQKPQLIGKLKEFYTDPDRAKRRGVKLRFILTSRPYRDIRTHFHSLIRKFPTIHLSGDEESDLISEEISHVISAEVSAIASERRLSSETENFLLEKLLNVENRTYLWLHLVLDRVRNSDRAGTTGDLQRDIEELPEKVEQLYEAILNKSKDHKLARKLLHIIVGAKFPLKIQELNVVMSIEDHHDSYKDLQCEDEDVFELRLKSICGLFIYTDHSKVFLIHQTAKEFLLWSPDISKASCGSWQHSLRPDESESLLARACVCLLTFSEFENHAPDFVDRSNDAISDSTVTHSHGDSDIDNQTTNSVKSDNKDFEGKLDSFYVTHVFFKYAAEYWPTHFNKAKSKEQNALFPRVVQLCNTTSRQFSLWFHIFRASLDEPLPQKIPDIVLATYLEINALVKYLLHQGHNVNATDGHGATALNRATSVEIARELLEYNADVEAQLWETPWKTEIDDRGSEREIKYFCGSPLYMAVMNDQEDLVQVLLEHGADVNAKTHGEMLGCASTVLHAVACGINWETEEEGDRSLSMARILLQHGAEVDARTGNHETLSVEVLDKLLCNDKSLAHTSILELSVQATALQLAVTNSLRKMVLLLVEYSADVDAEVIINFQFAEQLSDDGTAAGSDAHPHYEVHEEPRNYVRNIFTNTRLTAIHTAVENEDLAMIELLLHHGAKLNSKNGNKLTPLHYAAVQGHASVVQFLVNHGADIDAEDQQGDTPLAEAVYWHRVEVARLFLEKGAKIRPNKKSKATLLHYAATFSNTSEGNDLFFELMQRIGQDDALHAEDVYGNTPLFIALRSGNILLAESLIKMGARWDRTTVEGETILHVASACPNYSSGEDQIRIVKSLLTTGAEVNAMDINGITPLHTAVKWNRCRNLGLLKTLLENGANVNLGDNRGFTPLHIAMSGEPYKHRRKLQKRVVRMLLDFGAAVNSVTIEGQTPLSTATKHAREALIEYREAKEREKTNGTLQTEVEMEMDDDVIVVEYSSEEDEEDEDEDEDEDKKRRG